MSFHYFSHMKLGYYNILKSLGCALLLLSCQTQYAEKGTPPTNVDFADTVAEFNTLLKADSLTKRQRAAEAVNQFINDSIDAENAAILFRNKSDCNIIIRISGSSDYNLPILKQDINYLVLPKGHYQLRSKLCRSEYFRDLNLDQSIDISLSER